LHDEMYVIGPNIQRYHRPCTKRATFAKRDIDCLAEALSQFEWRAFHLPSCRALEARVRAIHRLAVARSLLPDPPSFVAREPCAVGAPR
jgi:hypothetical protein